MTISVISTLNTFYEWMTSHNSVITEVNKLLEGVFKTTGNVTITNTGAPGTIALNVANGIVKADGGLISNIANSVLVGTFKNSQLQNTAISLVFGAGLEGSSSGTLGGVAAQANLVLSHSIANTRTDVAPAANTINTVSGQVDTIGITLNSAFAQANTNSPAAAYNQANTARDKANTACTQSDQAGTNANNAYGGANASIKRIQVIATDSGFTWTAGDIAIGAASNTGNTLRIVQGGGANVMFDVANYAVRIGVFGYGKKRIWVPATAIISRTTNGCADGTAEMTTNKNMARTKDYDTSTQEFGQVLIDPPNSYDGGTVTFEPVWSHANTQTNFGVVWALQAVSYADADNFDVAFGTEQTSTDTGSANNRVYIGPESSAITVGGSPAGGRPILFQIKRNVSDGSDTLGVDARLHGFSVFFTTKQNTENG